ncbi:MAG: hypothetical protein R3230_01260 [Nitrosopumilaceae archaeon]|nr:hypothetical protein [Nitrosopumilaceae archaeon]
MDYTLGKKFARRRKDVNKDTFEGLCRIWCTHEEIRSILRIEENYLNQWCEEYYGESYNVVYERLTSQGNASLRRNQVKISEKNPTMAIWLGKQRLGQKENPDSEISFNGKLCDLLDALKGEKKETEDRSAESETTDSISGE